MSMNDRERTSFWARKKELDEVTVAIDAVVREQGIPLAAGRRAVRVTIHKGLRSRKRDDPANRSARAKSVLDALVRTGLLQDDDDERLLWRGVVEGERRVVKQTVIEIEDCADE